ncbi:hypothetical protein [Capillibacterium thermochitinicola]|uniref:Uncharacterized protein n=1 Tax=Capillibacterium thermochitinicola TaxID=2699427 RepID=A0A8J6HRN8_9FIRM|nr:hypothetical protein [Capillibacterium thermochitinicola]MBA2132846.1 hypothetical protein [Capillibacterium thermochitinicola]
MSKKYRWLKISGPLLAVILFFLTINSFFRENKYLLAERNAWQEKAMALEESYRQLQNENRELQNILDQGRPGLIITTLNFEPVAFNTPNRLTYRVTIMVANRSSEAIPAGSGELLFAVRQSGNGVAFRTSWQRFPLPSFQPGEVKTLPLTGELAATPREELLLVVSLNDQPGVAKVEVRLPEAAKVDVPQ